MSAATHLANIALDTAKNMERVAKQVHGALTPHPCGYCIAGYRGGMVDRSGVEHGLSLCTTCNGTSTMWVDANGKVVRP